MGNKQIEKIKRIRKYDLFLVFLKSFFLQSVWNFRSLISIGFGTCLFPIARRLYKDTESRREFLKRHLKFFNAHPYMASYALGVAIKLEEEFANGEPEACARLERLKDLLISILGAMGDQLFWLTIKPVCLITGAFGILVTENLWVRGGILIATFIFYNVPHIYLRYKGIMEGYQYGTEIYRVFNGGRFKKLRRFYFNVGIFFFLLFILTLGMRTFSADYFQFIVLTGSAMYAALFYRITNNFYYSSFFTFLFFAVVSFIFL